MPGRRLNYSFDRILILFTGVLLAGCSSSEPPGLKQEEINPLGKIGNAYDRATVKLGYPPRNLDQLKPFLKEEGDVDSLLRSPNDGQPYVILWGQNIRKVETMPPPIIAYEKQGVNGRRVVLTAMGVVPMDEEEFQTALKNKP